MSKLSRLRAMAVARVGRVRPGVAAGLFGGVMALAIGGAYLGGTAAKAAMVRDQAQRIDGVAAAGFTEEALALAAGGMDESALTIARRHDPYTVAGGAQRDRQAELLTARLESLRGQQAGGLRRISMAVPTAAQPFRLGGALDASRDLECLTQAVYYEARGEGRDGMRAVAQVVLNRARHPAFPKSVCGVVFQGSGRGTGCQFSFTCNGAMRGRVNKAAWDRARAVASSALSGSVDAAVGNATHFHTTGVSPQWRNTLVRVNQVGDHVFYRFGGRSGSSAAFTYAARRSTASDIQEPRVIQASLDPTAPVREAGAVAYNLLVSQEREEDAPRPAARAASPTNDAAPAASPAQPTGRPAPAPASQAPAAIAAAPAPTA